MNEMENTAVVTAAAEEKEPKKPGGNKKGLKRRTWAIIFYSAMMAIPVIQFVVMYIGVNLNSILLAFKEYDLNTGGYIYSGTVNFEKVIEEIANTQFLRTIGNSLIVFLFTMFLNLPLSVIFSYYIFKKFPGNKFFRVALYLPCIVSSVVMVTIYLYLMEETVPELIALLTGGDRPDGYISDPATAMWTLILYNVFFSFGTITMIFSSSMSSINTSVMEAATLDGCGLFQEFVYIVFPLSFNVIKLQMIVALVGIFTNQLNLYTFFGLDASPRLYTLGYYLYRGTLYDGRAGYPFYAAMGLLFSVVAIPIIFAFRSLFDKWDPSVEKKGKVKA